MLDKIAWFAIGILLEIHHFRAFICKWSQEDSSHFFVCLCCFFDGDDNDDLVVKIKVKEHNLFWVVIELNLSLYCVCVSRSW